MKIKHLILILIIIAFSGCKNRFYSEEDFPSVLKIDSHIHINSDDGAFEEQAAADNFLLITLNVDHGDSANIRKQFDYAVTSAKRYPGKVFFGPTFLFDTVGWGNEEWSKKIIAQLESDISQGAIAVKVWKNIGMTLRDRNGKFIMIDDPGLDPVVNFIKSKGIPITGHLGEPRNCWLPLVEMTVKSDSSYFARNPQYHMFLHQDYPSYEAQINARDNLLKKNPDLTFIACHLGSLEWNVDSLAARLNRFPNMAADISARTCHLQYQSAQDRERVRNFIIKYQDRLLYGTDAGYSGSNNPDSYKKRMHETWIDDWKYFATDAEMTSEKFDGKFNGLQLPKAVLNKLYSENAIKWYKLPVQKSISQKFHTWAPTPPMGWNSWDCYGPTVVESEVKANADYMSKHLKKCGWEYIVIDIRWTLENDKSGGYNQKDPVYTMDEYGRFTPALNRFPSAAEGQGFKPLADYVHSKGLKFGIHIMRGVPVIAVNKNTPILGSEARAQDIYSPEGQCKWLRDMYTIVAGKPGAQEYYNSIFLLYASWGVDFVKVDDLSGRTKEIEMVRKAIDNCGRPMVISISPGGDRPETIEFLKNNVNMWRTSNDFWDNWPALKNQFTVLNRWAGLGVQGCYPDGDMLPLGKIGLRAERGVPRWTGFTKDEQYTLMTLFSVFRSPLMFGGDLPGNDEFTLSLITNKDVLNVNQHSINGRQLFRENDLIAWTADDPKTGDKYLALFNASDSQEVAEISVRFEQLGLRGAHTVKDLWTGEKLGKFTDSFTRIINRHGSGLYRIH
ncbi:MAG: amidohydrolase family protein [Bacteroidia bacterium]|nr:amidohydrolase family protein [Bacteroidia bacterium]